MLALTQDVHEFVINYVNQNVSNIQQLVEIVPHYHQDDDTKNKLD